MGTVTINKNSGVTTLTINNFLTHTISLKTPVEVIPDITDKEDKAQLLKLIGPTMEINIEWNLVDEASSVVSGAGSPVTTAVAQNKYLYDTLNSTGVNAITDAYTLTIDYGGGVTLVRTGAITAISTIQTSDQPITFHGVITFQVGTTP